jgi:phospholipase/carboxylesterase
MWNRSRREFTAAVGSTLASLAFGDACSALTQPAESGAARIAARPGGNVTTSLETGRLGLSTGRDGVVQVPRSAAAGPVPLLVFLHGATQTGERMLTRIGSAADQLGIAVLAPDSRNGTWDGIRDRFGEDVAFLNRALEHVFARLHVDPARLAIGGFSDGASYGLSLGLANGSLFRRVVACSPGFVIQAPADGRPRIFVSHGTSDQILPIDQCSRVIVPRLKSLGYDLTYREFEGRHELPPPIAAEALRFMSAA